MIYRFIHPSRITKVALDPQARYAFSAGSKRLSAIWDLKTGKEVSRLHMPRAQESLALYAFQMMLSNYSLAAQGAY